MAQAVMPLSLSETFCRAFFGLKISFFTETLNSVSVLQDKRWRGAARSDRYVGDSVGFA
jgi:uncharacterized sodium:solute symporter family permease YidK